MNTQKLEQILKDNGQPRFRAGQITKAVYQDGVSSFSEISNLPKNLREILDSQMEILPFRAEKVLFSRNKLVGKALLKFEDGLSIETVIMSLREDVWSVCLSSQIGCPMGCAFCATGGMGFKRNLSSDEIFSQVLFWKQYLRKNQLPGRIANLVYMGMGEPFLNWEEVKKSLKVLLDQNFFNFGSRSISISTVGVPGGIEKMARDFPQVNLAVSLHFANDEARKENMPAGKNFDLADLKKTLEEYFSKSNRKVFLEYVLLRGLNDSEKDALELATYVGSFQKKHLLHVNLIRYNETSGKFKHSSFDQTQKFKKIILERGISVTERKSLGTDVSGACGQLAGGSEEKM
jgi:23S rRNA (adenine2503-C2)-methyltransferase